MGYKSPILYTLMMQSGNMATPLDTTDYFIGPSWSTLAGYGRIYFPRTGRITGFNLFFTTGTIGSAEDIVASVRINNTTDHAISTTFHLDAVRGSLEKYDFSIPAVRGEWCELKLSCPAWGTNPQNVVIRYQILIETE